MTRATTPPAARSRSASDAGTALDCATATASSGVSTWDSGALATPLVILGMLDYALGKSGGRDLGRAGHQPREIVRDAARPDCLTEPARDRRRHVVPPELFEHHRSRQDHTPRVDLVLPCVLRCGAVRRLEYGVPVAHVAARREPEPAHLRRRGVGEQVAVQVGCGDHRIGLGAPGPVLDAGVHVLDVLAEDHHVELVRLAHWAGHALEIAYRPDAGVQVEHLAQRHVEGADPSPNGRRERAFDGHAVRPDGLERGLGKPGPDLFEGLLAGQHLEPIDLPFGAGHLLHRGVEYTPGGAPDVGPGAVAFDERDDGVARHHPATVAIFDALTHGQAVYTARPGLRQAKQRPYT